MYQRILVPVDGSATSNRGLAEAIAIAKASGGTLRVMHVVDEPFMALGMDGFSGSAGQVIELLQQAARGIVDDACALARAAGVGCDSVIGDTFDGRVCDLVVAAARDWKADLIVIGTHGRRGVGRVVMGSDAEQILRQAPVAVLLVRGIDAPPIEPAH
jgi:nucleotide-binding universal stress UspA family protein